jgi:hypothetical protein
MSEDFAFLAGLALTSIGRGQPASRAANLARVVKYAEKAVAAGTVPVTHLAVFWRLVLEDKARMGDDPVPLAVGQAGRSLQGDLPLSFAENLLTDSQDLFRGRLAQTRRIVLCERAFEAGFEVQNLIEMAKAAPFLGHAMQTSDIDGLAGLRLLWSLRPRRPWDHLGPVETVFDLAAKLGERHSERSEESPQAVWSRPFAALRVTSRRGNENAVLEKHPDLLLAAADGSELYLCGRGVVFQSQVFTQPPRSIEVKKERIFRGWELVIDDCRFQYFQDPGPIAQRVEHWFRYYFGDWAHQIRDVFNWRSPGLPTTFRLRKTYPCPECGRELYPRAGDLAITT